MKKSLMAAALVALSSTAFADKDSFVVGLSGQYFKPLGEGKCEMNRPHFPTDTVEDANKSKQFFISPYVGYNINEMFRVGLTVMWNPIGYQFKHENTGFRSSQRAADLIALIGADAIAATRVGGDLALAQPPAKPILDRIEQYTSDMTAIHFNAADHLILGRDFTTAKNTSNTITHEGFKNFVQQVEQVAISPAPELNITDCYKPLPILATGDVKLFENSTLSLSAGVGLGMTRWSHEYQLTSSADDGAFQDPGQYETASAWTAAGKVEVAGHFNLADVATLSVSGGYMYLGAPKKFEHGGDDNNKEVQVSKDLPSSGLLLSVGVSKEF